MEPAGKALAAWAASLEWRDLSVELREKLVDHVVDAIGVMYSGIGVEACIAARRAASMWGSGNEATVVGTNSRMPPAGAAFVNALHGRIHTYDDTYEPGTMHAGTPVIAAGLAVAESKKCAGPSFLAAVLAGYEVASRVAAAVSPSHYSAGFHNTGTCTVFGTTAVASRLLGLDAPAVAEAFGLAGAAAAGLRQHQIDGSMFDSAFHGARAAQSGVMIGQLRAEGVKGPTAILEGPLGFCTVMSPKRELSRLTEGLGNNFEFSKISLKPYPTCRFVHGPTEAVLTLKHRHGIDAAGVRAVTIATFKQSIEVSSRPEIGTPYDGVVSHQYSAALALVKGKIELAAIGNAATADADVLALMRRVRVVHDAELEKEYPRSWPHRVTIEMSNGERHSILSEYPPGRTSPIPRATVDQKFLEQCAGVLGAERASNALAALRGIAEVDDIRVVTAALTPA